MAGFQEWGDQRIEVHRGVENGKEVSPQAE